MNKTARKALEGSIKKWERIVDGTGFDDGINNCPLCHIFYDDYCSDCPVCIKVGVGGCEQTPYSKWNDHVYQKHSGETYQIHCPECKKLAEKELAFLESLWEKA